MKRIMTFTLLSVIAALYLRREHAEGSMPPLQTVAHVDLARYVGKWYEIARYPNSFQKGCLGSTAEYTMRGDGDINVLNSCRDAATGRTRLAKGHAWVVDKQSNARLKVSFFWPFRGDYWIIDLGSEYEYAVIGTPDRKYFWILARNPVMDDALFSAIMERAAAQGFDPTRLIRSTCPPSSP